METRDCLARITNSEKYISQSRKKNLFRFGDCVSLIFSIRNGKFNACTAKSFYADLQEIFTRLPPKATPYLNI